MRAWCWASGRIDFGRSVPEGALLIMSGPSKALRAFVEVRARHAYDGVTLLVPGVPEAPDQSAALDALHRWLDWNAEHAPAEIEVA